MDGQDNGYYWDFRFSWHHVLLAAVVIGLLIFMFLTVRRKP
jgi:uncharacterized integral membrane protein